MSSNAETLARVILEIDRILGEYLEPLPPNGVQDAKGAIEQILLEMDRSDAVGAAERVLSGYIGPTLVK
jgi:hypothetical protein